MTPLTLKTDHPGMAPKETTFDAVGQDSAQEQWEHVNHHHIRRLLFSSPKLGFMLPWGSDPLSVKGKTVNALSTVRLLNSLLDQSFTGCSDQPFSPVCNRNIFKAP